MVDDAVSTHPDSQSYIFTSISAVKVNAKSFSMTGKRTVAVVVIILETDNRREREERVAAWFVCAEGERFHLHRSPTVHN